jgi:hypothetical protein
MSQQINTDEMTIDIESLISPPQLPMDLLSEAAALEIPFIAFLIAITAVDPRLGEYLSDPAKAKAVPVLNAFREWIAAQESTGTREQWADYILDSHEKVTESTWNLYDDEVPQQVPPEVRVMIGDELTGTALFMSWLNEVGLLTDEEEIQFRSLWNYWLVADLMSDDDSETVDASAEPMTDQSESNEW